jgi:hypothetical protein
VVLIGWRHLTMNHIRYNLEYQKVMLILPHKVSFIWLFFRWTESPKPYNCSLKSHHFFTTFSESDEVDKSAMLRLTKML